MPSPAEFRGKSGTHPCVFSGYARDGEEVGCAYPRQVSMASHAAREAPPWLSRSAGARTDPMTTLAEQYARLARETPERSGVDLELRALDVFFSAFFLLLSLPLALVIGLAILATSGRPVFYRGRRVGRGGRIFTMTKFRTLRPGAEARIGQHLGSSLVAHTDSEVTRIGRRLRATQLDEIPQLWHVLKGDMSLVGPRPIRPRFFEELAAELPAYWQRLVVRPGLTGFAQVRRGYETSMAEKLAHDLEWIADRSVLLYLRTLSATAWRVLRQSLRSLFRPAP
jgi:lipopolysaccharide/colanic/teichoic acid biosynthesis glycosyltransferase